MSKTIKPKEIINEQWEKSFKMAPSCAFNAESCLLAAQQEIKVFDIVAAQRDIRSAIGFIQTLRHSIPPVSERGKPKIVK